MELLEFKSYCNNKRCLRKTFISKKCTTKIKQEKCYSKYLLQVEKNNQKKQDQLTKQKNKLIEIDEKWEETKKQIWLRDAHFYNGHSKLDVKNQWKIICRFWKCLNREEQEECENNLGEYFWLNQTLDVAHIISRAKSKELYYEPDNLLLVGNLFHGLLDKYKSPITGDSIEKEERSYWFERMVDPDHFKER